MATRKTKAELEEEKAELEEEKAELEEEVEVLQASVAVRVDNMTRRSDDDALEGHFARVIAGEHAGQNVLFVRPETVGADGYPETVLVTFRDHSYDTASATLPYEDLRPTSYLGGR